MPALPAGEQRARVVPGNTRDTAHTHSRRDTRRQPTTHHIPWRRKKMVEKNGDQKTRDVFFWKKKVTFMCTLELAEKLKSRKNKQV